MKRKTNRERKKTAKQMANATHCKIGHNWILCCKVILLWWIQEYIKHISTYMGEQRKKSVILLQQASEWVRENGIANERI